ncbi:hypothetical protein JKP88DRAFT_291525 [Tribonema minus]|uniref:Uncharacterized protein n=1 Tax=Tribonema minus TaxID=303371 RepID=A0A835ZFY4_9STRA|nr:hypothetical protein JKP88DRAFT_291525 [Tribonema minus]
MRVHVRALLLIAAGRGAAARSATATRVANPLFYYEFTDAACATKAVRDTSGNSSPTFGSLSLVGNLNCTDAVGITGTDTNRTDVRMTSQYISTGFMNQMTGKAGFTLEMWLSHPSTFRAPGFQNTLLSIGTATSPFVSAYSEWNLACEYCSNLDLAYSSKYMRYMLYFRRHETLIGTGTCAFNYSASHQYNAGPGVPQHVVVTVDLSAVQPETGNDTTIPLSWYLNGGDLNAANNGSTYNQSSYYATFNGFNSVWATSYKLQLFSDYRTAADQKHVGANGEDEWYAPWPGTIFSTALYPRVLNAKEIKANYDAYIPNVPPVPKAFNVTVLEDGMTAARYDTPAYYRADVPALDLATIAFPAPYDYESDAAANALSYSAANPAPTLWLASLPSRGTLYTLAGAAVTSAATQIANATLRYRPARDQFSAGGAAYATFRYVAADGVTGARSAEATVTIFVTAQDDPPVVVARAVTVAAAVATKICGNGTDVDAGDSVRNYYISTAPSSGKLYYVVDGAVTMTEASAASSAAAWFGAAQACIGYRYTGAARPDAATGLIGFDGFTYAGADNATRASVPAAVNITLVSPLHSGDGTANKTWTVPEDAESSLRLYGTDTSDAPRALAFHITAVPAVGDLLDAATDRKLRAGDKLTALLSAPYGAGVEVKYRPPADFFTTPTVNASGAELAGTGAMNFSYYVALAGDALYRAPEAAAVLSVVNVNDATALACPDAEFSVAAAGKYAYDTDFETPVADRAFLRGFALGDADAGVDLIRVTVAATKGVVSLQPDQLGNLDFTSTALCFGERDWRCAGNGINDATVTFVAPPAAAAAALDGLRYQSDAAGVTDAVTVTVYDGSGGALGADCIADAHFTSNSTRDGCLRSTCAVTVTVAKEPGGGGGGLGGIASANGGVFSAMPLQAWIGIAAGAVLVIGVGAKLLFFSKAAASGSANSADGFAAMMQQPGAPDGGYGGGAPPDPFSPVHAHKPWIDMAQVGFYGNTSAPHPFHTPQPSSPSLTPAQWGQLQQAQAGGMSSLAFLPQSSMHARMLPGGGGGSGSPHSLALSLSTLQLGMPHMSPGFHSGALSPSHHAGGGGSGGGFMAGGMGGGFSPSGHGSVPPGGQFWRS